MTDPTNNLEYCRECKTPTGWTSINGFCIQCYKRKYPPMTKDDQIAKLKAELATAKAEVERLKNELMAMKLETGVLTGKDAERFEKQHNISLKRIENSLPNIDLPTIDPK